MRPHRFRILLAALVAAIAMPAPAQLISEILWNPPGGTDTPNEFIEIVGTPNATLGAGTYLVFIEGDALDGPGGIDAIFDLSGLTFGTNGFLLLLQNGHPYTPDPSATTVVSGSAGFSGIATFDAGNSLENGSFSALLITAPAAPTLAQDIDSDNNGTPNGTPFTTWTVLDSIGVADSLFGFDSAYSTTIFANNGVNNPPPGGQVVDADGAFGYLARRDGFTGDQPVDWATGAPAGTAPSFTIGTSVPANNTGLPIGTLGGSNNVLPVSISGFEID